MNSPSTTDGRIAAIVSSHDMSEFPESPTAEALLVAPLPPPQPLQDPALPRGRAHSNASRAPSSRTHTPATQTRQNQSFDGPERKGSLSYGHHRQTSIVHGYQHSRNPSHVSSANTSPLSPQVILATAAREGHGHVLPHGNAPPMGLGLRKSPSAATLNGTSTGVIMAGGASLSDASAPYVHRRPERMHSTRVKHDHDHHQRERSRHHHHQQQEPTTVGEYALHHLLNEFISEANERINRCVSEPDDALIRIEAICGPGADSSFDQLIKALGHIVRPRPKPLIDAVMIWRKSKSEETAPLYAEYESAKAAMMSTSGTIRRADTSHASTNSSSASLGTQPDANTLARLDQAIKQGERRSAISVYILCRVLMEVIGQCSLEALTSDIAHRLEDVIYTQLRGFDPDQLAKSAIKQSQWHMFAQLLGVMSNLRFDKVVDRFTADLEMAQRKLSVKGHTETLLENKTALLVHSMRWLKVQSFPEDAWHRSCDLLQLLASFFAGVHGKPVKYAYCQLFEDLLLPIAGRATSELNLPKWRHVLDTLRPKLAQLLVKPKHWVQAFPLLSVIICVSPTESFSQQWLSTALGLQPRLKERATRSHALKALCRLVWVFLYRSPETQSNTARKLEDVIKMIFQGGKRSILSTEPSIADPLIQFIRIIGFKQQDLCFRSIIFPMMNSEIILNGGRKIEYLDPERMVIAIRAFLAIMSDLEKGEQPPFPITFDCDALSDPFSRAPNTHRRSVSQSSISTSNGRVERLSKPVMTAGLGDVAKDSYVKFCKILGEITIICDETFGGQKVLDEKISAQTTPKTPMAEAFSFSRREELLNSPEVRQNFYDLLHVAVQALPRCLSPQIPLKNLINLLCTGTAHIQNHIATSSAQSLKSIARQSHAQLVTIGFARFIFNFDDRYATVSAGSLLGHGHIESTLRLYVELLEIWIEDLQSQPNMAGSDLQDEESPITRGLSADLNRSRVFAHVDEIESHGLFFLCSPSRHVRAFAVRVLRLVTKFDTALGQPSTRIVSVLEGSSQQVIDVNDEKLSLAERSRLQKGLRKSNMNNTLVELCSSDTVHDLTLWSKAFPNLIRLSSQICPQAVLLTRDIVCARLSHAHKTISSLAEGPRANNYTALETTFANRMVGRSTFGPPEVTIEQWKLHLIFACTTLTSSGSQPVASSQSSQHSRKGSKASSIGAEKIASASELFFKVVPFLSANHPGVREAAVQGLGAINMNLFRILLESLQPSVQSCSDDAKQWLATHQRSASSPRRSRRSDSLRTEVTHLYQLTSHCLEEPDVYNDEWILQNLVSYTKDLRIFLNDEEVQNQLNFQKLRTYYCGLVEILYEGIRHTKDPSRWMPFQARKAAFAMMEDWCGFSPNQSQIRQKETHMMNSVLDQEHDSRSRGNVTAKMEIEKKELRTAALSAMAALCAGPVTIATDGQITMQFDVRRMLKWIDAIFDSASDRTHSTGRRALRNLLIHNKEHVFLLGHSIEECYHARNPKALLSYFDVVMQVLTEEQDDRIPFWKMLSACLYTLGNEDSNVRMKSGRLLRTLEERLGKSSKLQDLDISISDKTRAVYKLAQFETSRRLSKNHAEIAFHVFSEFTKHFGGLHADHQRNMVAAMLPWIQTIELQLLPHGGPTASSYMLMCNLFEITARSPSALHNEIQALWQALATGPYGGNVQVVLDFIIAVCLDRREQNFVDYAKQIVVFLSSTAAGLKVVEFLLLQINPKAMVAEKHPPPPVPQDFTRLPYIADLNAALPMGNRQSGLSLGQLALMLLVDLVVSPIQVPKDKIPLLLQIVVVQWDHYTPLVQDQAREMLVHMIHELVISRIEPGSTTPDKQSIEELIESIRRHDPKVVWTYEETETKDASSETNGVPEPMLYIIEEVVKVLAVSYDESPRDNIRKDWAKMSLMWATSCAVRHVACRSFQIFRCIIDTLDQQMLADMLARLANTIADDENDCLTFSREILITLRTIIAALEPEDLIQYPQLFWTTSACLDTIFEQEFQESLTMVDRLLNKLNLSDPAVMKLFQENKPQKWEGEFEGLQPLVYKGLRSSACLDHSLEMLERMIKLPSSPLIGDDTRLLFTVLANLPRYLYRFEDDTTGLACFESADNLGRVAEFQGQGRNLAMALYGYARREYRTAQEFLERIVPAITEVFFPAQEYKSLVFLIGLLNNQIPWFKIKVMQLLCVLIPEVDMRRPEIASQGPDLISPLLRLLQTSFCQQALDVLDNIMSMTNQATPLDNKHLRMSMAGSHSTRATRKEYDSTKSLYGIPEESGWSIPMPAFQAKRARDNVYAVYCTCVNANTDEMAFIGTPEVEFADEQAQNGYFPERTQSGPADSVRADGSMGELVLKLDSLDDFFDDDQVNQRVPTPGHEIARYSVEDRENVYEQQTLPILHKSLRRNASVTSFQNGFTDVRYTSPREPFVMTPTAFAVNPIIASARPGLHLRSVTSPAAQIKRTPPILSTDLMSGDEGGDEPFSDDDGMSITRKTTSEDSLSANSFRPVPTGIRANFRSGMRRLTGGSSSAGERKEIQDAIRGKVGMSGQRSPKVPKVPAVWLSNQNPRSADL